MERTAGAEIGVCVWIEANVGANGSVVGANMWSRSVGAQKMSECKKERAWENVERVCELDRGRERRSLGKLKRCEHLFFPIILPYLIGFRFLWAYPSRLKLIPYGKLSISRRRDSNLIYAYPVPTSQFWRREI